ncbi:MAG: polysaccharide deacetylase family protein [Bacillus sp. (in: Bacteria)]|nr:polysaccharide deacetylase family protein [Bacillus sp. (in: firmicutes)]
MRKKVMVVVVCVVVLMAAVYFTNELSKSRSFQFFGGLVTDVATEEKVVALTFDDGPGENTAEVIEVLGSHEVLGTFFLTGREIEEDIDGAIALVEAGHEIGNHSFSHSRMVFKSPGFVRVELEATDKLIRQAGYEGEIHFRPPYGRRLLAVPYFLWREDRKTILWSVEPESYPEVSMDAGRIADYVVENVEPGGIILLHVMYDSRRESLAAVEPIIVRLKAEGYRFVTVSELLELGEG